MESTNADAYSSSTASDAGTSGPPKLNVLLWSPPGSSEAYHGPGSFAYRLYSSAPTPDLRVTLAHGHAPQPTTDLYAEHCHVAAYRPDTWGQFRFVRQCRGWLRENANRFDVLHGLSGYHYTMAPAFYAQQLGLPSVIFLASHKQDIADKPGLKSLLGLPRRRRQMLRQLSGVIAMSQALYDEVVEYGISPRKIARIPMGVNTDRFKPCEDAAAKRVLRESLGLDDRPTIVFVGVLAEYKRPDVLIEAFGKVVARHSDCQLVMLGPAKYPRYAEQLHAQVERLKLQNHLVWIDYTQQIEQYLAAADLFCLPSSSEGMPAAVVEAMSAGLPCLGTPISGITDLIQDQVTGRLIPQDPVLFAEAIVEYLNDERLRAAHGQAGRSVVLSSYSCEIVLDAYREMFRRVVAGQDVCEASTLSCVVGGKVE